MKLSCEMRAHESRFRTGRRALTQESDGRGRDMGTGREGWSHGRGAMGVLGRDEVIGDGGDVDDNLGDWDLGRDLLIMILIDLRRGEERRGSGRGGEGREGEGMVELMDG